MLNKANLRNSLKQSIIGGFAACFPSFLFSRKQAGELKSLSVFCYHNIIPYSHSKDEMCCDDYSFINLPLEIFIKQIHWIKKNFEVITMDDLINEIDISPRSAIITFDDGFRSVHTLAFPFLRSIDISATIFLTGAHIKEQRLPWISHLHYIIDNGYSDKKVNILGKSYCLRTKTDKIKLLIELKSYFKTANYNTIIDVLTQVEEKLNINVPEDIFSKKFLHEEEIQELSCNGWTVGNHSYNHTNLRNLCPHEITREIVDTQRALSRFSQYRDILAVPFGDKDSFNVDVIRIALENDIQFIFTTKGGINTIDTMNNEIGRIICETYSFLYFKSLAQGKKNRIEESVRRFI